MYEYLIPGNYPEKLSYTVYPSQNYPLHGYTICRECGGNTQSNLVFAFSCVCFERAIQQASRKCAEAGLTAKRKCALNGSEDFLNISCMGNILKSICLNSPTAEWGREVDEFIEAL